MNIARDTRHVIRTRPVRCDRILNGRYIFAAQVAVRAVVAGLQLAGIGHVGAGIVLGVLEVLHLLPGLLGLAVQLLGLGRRRVHLGKQCVDLLLLLFLLLGRLGIQLGLALALLLLLHLLGLVGLQRGILHHALLIDRVRVLRRRRQLADRRLLRRWRRGWGHAGRGRYGVGHRLDLDRLRRRTAGGP